MSFVVLYEVERLVSPRSCMYIVFFLECTNARIDLMVKREKTTDAICIEECGAKFEFSISRQMLDLAY